MDLFLSIPSGGLGSGRSREGQRISPTCLAKPGRKTRLAFLLSQLRPTSPDFANGRGRGANRPFPGAEPRGSPELLRAVGAGPRSPPSIPELSEPLSSVASFAGFIVPPGLSESCSGAAGRKLASIREAIFGVADQTSNERSFAHEG